MTGSERRTNEGGRRELPGSNDERLTQEELLVMEITRIIERNKNQRYLKALLTRAKILEDTMK